MLVHASKKVLEFSPDGRLLREIATTHAGPISRIFMDSKGFFYADAFETEPERSLARFLLKKFDSGMEPVKIIASQEVRMPQGIDRRSVFLSILVWPKKRPLSTGFSGRIRPEYAFLSLSPISRRFRYKYATKVDILLRAEWNYSPPKKELADGHGWEVLQP